jgi:hypothetical protein
LSHTKKKCLFASLETLYTGTRTRSSIRPAFSSHTQPRTQAQETDGLGGGEIVERIKQNLQMPGEMLLVLLQDREQLLKLLFVNSLGIS